VRRTRLLRILICIRDHPTAIAKRRRCAGKYYLYKLISCSCKVRNVLNGNDLLDKLESEYSEFLFCLNRVLVRQMPRHLVFKLLRDVLSVFKVKISSAKSLISIFARLTVSSARQITSAALLFKWNARRMQCRICSLSDIPSYLHLFFF